MNKVKVGIPRALMYYYQYPLWEEFFKELNAEVLVSPKSNKGILSDGIKSAIDEACLPVKLFYGHVIWLKDKVDYIFVPRLISIEEKEYICPKFMGLPDMIKANIEELPPIIDASIDLSKNKKHFEKFPREVGRLFTSNRFLIKKAWKKALQKQKRFEEILVNKQILPYEAIEYLEEEKSRVLPSTDYRLTIALLGHGYNIFDEHISMDVIKKLRQKGIKVVTPDTLPAAIIDSHARKLPKKMFWTFGKKNIGGVDYYLETGKVDGMIHIASFGCGPDSLVGEIIYRKAKEKKVPVLNLTIDEHTGEAGIVTRIEAFIDMLTRRMQNESNLSPHG